MTAKDAVTIAAEFAHMKYCVFGNRVAIIMDDRIAETSGGIFIPEGIPKHSATVVMVGPGVALDKDFSAIRETDRVLINRYAPPAQEVILQRLDGSEVVVKLMHSHDCYVGWRDEDLRKQYVEECKAFGIPMFEPGSMIPMDP